jgi:hypothetical protein
VQSFGDLRLRDAEFAQAWDAALESFLGELEHELVRRALEPPKRGVYHQGKLIDVEENRAPADKLLLRLLERHDPEWRPGRTIDQHVQVDVRAAILAIQPADVLLLDPTKRDLFLDLLREIAEAKGETGENPRLSGPGATGEAT